MPMLHQAQVQQEIIRIKFRVDSQTTQVTAILFCL